MTKQVCFPYTQGHIITIGMLAGNNLVINLYEATDTENKLKFTGEIHGKN